MEGLCSPNSAKRFLPTTAGTLVARRLQANPDQTKAILNNYGYELQKHYTKTGMTAHDHSRAYILTTHNKFRAAFAVVCYVTEVELFRRISRLRQESSFSPGSAIDAAPDHLTTRDQEYGERPLDFLRTLGGLVNTVWWESFGQLESGNHPLSPVWEASCVLDSTMMTISNSERRWPGTPQHRQRDNMLASNITILRVLAARAHHLHNRGVAADAIPHILQSEASKLAYAASTKVDRFDRLIGLMHKEAPSVEGCPFSHSDDAPVWGTSTLKRGPWKAPGFCPEAIPLAGPLGLTTGAELRIRVAIPIAQATGLLESAYDTPNPRLISCA